MTLQDLMMLYGVTLGKRRTAKQKYLFAQQLNESLPPLGWPVRVQQREGRFSKIENLIAGDLANAKVVIAVPFDTPAKALRPQKYYPFHPDKNVQQRGRDLALQCVLELLCFGAACLMFWSGRGTGAMLPRTLAEKDSSDNPYISIVMGASEKPVLYEDMTSLIEAIPSGQQ